MRSKHYSPAIHRFLVSALFHEAKARRVKMTVLVNQLLSQSLTGGTGWQEAMKQLDQQAQGSATP
jgi:hypothetical protein